MRQTSTQLLSLHLKPIASFGPDREFLAGAHRKGLPVASMSIRGIVRRCTSAGRMICVEVQALPIGKARAAEWKTKRICAQQSTWTKDLRACLFIETTPRILLKNHTPSRCLAENV